jgi:hypothetical protein
MQILFSKTIEECRQLGARGGRAFARNQRLRKSQTQTPRPALLPDPPAETAHQASLLLDAQFPWLVGAFAPRPHTRRCGRRSQPAVLSLSANPPFPPAAS